MPVLGEAKECKVGSMIVDVEVPKCMSPHPPTNSVDDHISVIEKKEEQIDLFCGAIRDEGKGRNDREAAERTGHGQR